MSSAILFDLDGVLVDSEPLHFAVYRECLADVGVDLTQEEFTRRVVHGGAKLEELLEERGLGAHADAAVAALLERLLPRFEAELRPLPGAAEALRRARAAQHALALVTSSRRVTTEAKLARCGLAGAFDALVTRESVERLKPAPDAFLLAAELLGVPPERCVVVEDADKGLRAGRAAGMTTVAVPAPGVPVSPELADYVFASLDEIPFEALPR